MITNLLVSIFIFFIVIFFFTMIVLMFKKSTICPVCEGKFKGITKTIKCPRCKAELYKDIKGEYRIQN